MFNFIKGNNKMRLESFAGIKIFRPNQLTEREIRDASEAHLRSKFEVGRYTNKDDINAIIQHQFKFYEKTLEELLPKLVSRDFLEFVLFQFESASKAESLYKAGKLNITEASRWKEINKTIRRALKFLAELIVLFQPPKAPLGDQTLFLSDIEKVWICVEEMVEEYVVSDQTHAIYPNDSYLEIFPLGHHDYLQQGLLSKDLSEIERRIYLDSDNRSRFIHPPTILFDIEKHNDFIGEAVKASIGATYSEAISVLGQIIENSAPLATGLPILFLHKATLIKRCSEIFGITPLTAEKIVSGFSISKAQLTSEGRELWKPRQEYRAYRRAFFEYPHLLGTHLVFSKEMAKECLLMLIKDVVFGKLPKEWLSPPVNIALSLLSNEAGKWFETIVENNFSTRNFVGIKSAKKGIGEGSKRIEIPTDIGEIDYIGFSEKENIILVGECKLVRDSPEPQFFRKDIDQFVNSNKSYIKKFRKKVDWIRTNIDAVSEALSSTKLFKTTVSPKKVAGVMITFVPTIASDLITDYPCVSLTEFMLDYESEVNYPYEIGIYSVE